MARISFVVPFYQKSKSINKCLRSLFSQSVKDIEVIVVMDGPDPDAKRLISKHRAVKLVEIPHGGACAARNAGEKVATSDIIVFWDADCYIEHGAAQVWLQIFEKNPDVDFVYSGYRFQEGMGAIEGEPFDPWLLRINNYISGCFPIRRAKAPKWDESLKSLQDWDFWLTAVDNGCKGYFVRGYAFQTDFPDAKSISGTGCQPSNWMERVQAVKTKHKCPDRKMCVTAISSRHEGMALAKMIDADYMDLPTRLPTGYNTIMQIGFSPRQADHCARNFVNQYSKEPLKKILFWRSHDVYSLKYEAAKAACDALAQALNSIVDYQFCEDEATRNELHSLGFKAVILPLPLDTSKVDIKPLPQDFKVLMDIHPDYHMVFESIQRACPDIPFTQFTGAVNCDDYSIMLKFSPDRCIDANTKRMLLNGRHIVSNINSPHCGYIEEKDADIEDMRIAIIAAIRRHKRMNALNLEGSSYYKSVCSPQKFRDVLDSIDAFKAKAVAA